MLKIWVDTERWNFSILQMSLLHLVSSLNLAKKEESQSDDAYVISKL